MSYDFEEEEMRGTQNEGGASGTNYIADFTRFRNAMRKIFPRRQTLEEEIADLAAAKKDVVPARDRLVAANVGSITSVVKRAIHKGALSYSEVLEAWDLLQAGVFGFYDAIKRYKNTDGTRLGPYATWRVKDFVLRAVGNSYVLTSGGTSRITRILGMLRKREREVSLKLGREPRQSELLAGLSENERNEFVRMRMVAEAVVGHASIKGSTGNLDDYDGDYEVPDEGEDSSGDIFYGGSFTLLQELLENPLVLTGKQRQVLYMLYAGDEDVDFTKIGRRLEMTKEGAWRSHDRAIKKLRRYF